MLLITIGVVFLLFVVSYLIFDKDLLAPPTVVALTFLFGCLCCLYNENTWGLNFSLDSMELISAGIVATMLGGIVGVILSNRPKLTTYSFFHGISKPEEIEVHPLKTWIVIAFQLVTVVLVFNHICRVTGYSSWGLAVAKYKLITGYQADVNDTSTYMSFLTRNMNEASRLIAFVYAYIIGNNLVASKKKISINWIPVVVYTILSFMQGGRANLVRLWLVVLITAYTVHKRSVGWVNNKATKRVIRIIALSVIAVGILFSGVRGIVGRTADSNLLDYVTFYAGSPIAVLNQVWEAPVTQPAVFGERILYYFNQTTRVLFGVPERYTFYYRYMQSPNGSHIGNAPTAFRPAFVEFGPVGFLLFFIACGAFFTYLYCKCRQKRGNSSFDFRLLVYSYISYTFMMYFYSTFFDFLSHLFIKYLIEMYLIKWFLVGWQIKPDIRVLVSKRTRSSNQFL
ncbi:MAG: oligosaccharide repeat unit polymerase [Clostridia bacterium]|nr:oligosaccharide repeat unit polymerase [Clostridia bacterium]